MRAAHGPILREVFGGRGDDGLIQRFQLVVWPDVAGPWRNVDRWPDAAARARAVEIFQRLNRAYCDIDSMTVPLNVYFPSISEPSLMNAVRSRPLTESFPRLSPEHRRCSARGGLPLHRGLLR